MTVSAQYDLKLIVTETPALALDLAANPDIIHQITGSHGTLNASGSVTATCVIDDQIGLTAGTYTLDVTAFVRTTLATVDATGLKLKLWKVKAASTNTDVVTIATGAATGYALFGTAGKLVLGPGEEAAGARGLNGVTVTSSLKNIDMTSPDADAIVQFIFVF